MTESNNAPGNREQLLLKLESLSTWCEKNNEWTTAAVILTLRGSLVAQQDTLFMLYTSEFSRQMIKVIERKKADLKQ